MAYTEWSVWETMKSVSMEKYFEVVNPKYVYYRIIPLKSIRNYDADSIIATVAGLYRDVFKRIEKQNKKYFFTTEVKMAYYIYMEPDKIEFYFILPNDYKNLLLSKVRDVWKGVTIEEVPSIPGFTNEAIRYSMNYSKQDAFSLSCDKRNNVLLGAICQNIALMEDGEKVGVFYNFIPRNITSWRFEYDRITESIKDGGRVYKTGGKALMYAALGIVIKFCDFAFEIVEELLGDKKEANEKYPLEMTSDSLRKRDKIVVKAQVVVMAESIDKQRANNLATSMCECFKCISGDNELTYVKLHTRKEITLTDTYIKSAGVFTASAHECQNFLSLPAREIIEEFKIDCINTTQTQVPDKLQHGYINLGTNTFRGNSIKAYLRDTYDQGNFPLVLVGEQGSGKSTYIGNYVKNIQSRDEGCIVIDYIKNCELANSIEQSCKDKSKLIILDMSNADSVQGIGYNELQPKNNTPIEILDIANRKALYILTLIDALNTDGTPLSSSMDRYLSAACNIVFLKSQASLRDIVRCLNDYKYRGKCIADIDVRLKQMLEDEISALLELDDYDKDGVLVGTKMIKVDGVNHRINLLKKDLRLKMMFQKSCENNIDLVKAMNEGKIILVKMPQEYFATPYSKNVIVTYWLTKIWSAMLVRGSTQNQPKRFHVIIDEVFQAPTAMQLLKTQEICPQTRKFGCKFVFSCQYLKQIGTIDQTLRSAGASYMLMKGSGKANFNEFKEELYPYTLEDMEALAQYECLNLINYEEGRAKFITKLPKP